MRSQHEQASLKHRLKQEQDLSKLYPQNIRVELHPSSNSKLKKMSPNVISVAKKVSIGSITQTIRKKLEIKESDAIFVFAERTILHFNDIVGDVFNRFKDKLSSATLILEYTQYSVFGS